MGRCHALLSVLQDWHQKLHNNTTPDDIVICEAFIAFLEGNGDNGAYWRHLTDNGITRERLESFDRAIKVLWLASVMRLFAV
jgi:alpha-glucan,water dikinase